MTQHVAPATRPLLPDAPVPVQVPALCTTFDRDGRRVVLTGVVTHDAGGLVAFEYEHPERGLWLVWAARLGCARLSPGAGAHVRPRRGGVGRPRPCGARALSGRGAPPASGRRSPSA